MATLSDLQNRIISETNRDDLADDLASQFQVIITKSIDYYANERWWFNERRLVTNATPNQNYIPWPSNPNARWLDGVYVELNLGATRWPVQARSTAEWELLNQPVPLGQPTDYLVTNDPNTGNHIIQLFPTPNQAWQMAIDYIADVTPTLVNATDTNFWTNVGQDLITAQAKIRLYRDYLSANVQDPRLALAIAEEKEAYSRLRAESTRRTATGRLQPAW